MSLMMTASRVLNEYGEEGLRRWEERLTPEQRIALVHEADQFGAGMQEISRRIEDLVESLRATIDELGERRAPR